MNVKVGPVCPFPEGNRKQLSFRAKLARTRSGRGSAVEEPAVLLGSAIKQVSRLRVFVRSRSQSRSARNDSELKLIVANRVKHGKSKGTDRTLTSTAEALRRFIEALLNPPKPNEKAIAAARRLKEEIA